MEFLDKIEPLARTFDNRVVLNLFDLLLCGVIVLVIIKGSILPIFQNHEKRDLMEYVNH